MAQHTDGTTSIKPHGDGYRMVLRATSEDGTQKIVGEHHLTRHAFQVLEAALWKAKAEAEAVDNVIKLDHAATPLTASSRS